MPAAQSARWRAAPCVPGSLPGRTGPRGGFASSGQRAPPRAVPRRRPPRSRPSWFACSWTPWPASSSSSCPQFLSVDLPSPATSGRGGEALVGAGFKGFDQLGHNREDVTDNAEVCDIEDGGVLVFVDRHNRLGRLHTGQMLDRAGNTQRYIKLGGNRDARLSDLRTLGDVACINRRAGTTHGTAESIGKLLDQHKALLGPQATAAGDNGRSVAKRWSS